MGAGRFVLVIAVAACGRVGFDTVASDSGFVDPIDAPDASLGAWGQPVVLNELRGDGAAEADPSISEDRLVIVWSSQRTGNVGSYDIWTASRSAPGTAFGAVRNISEINTLQFDGSPEISANGLTLYVANPSAGMSDFYVSTRASRGVLWGTAQLATDLSSTVGGDDELAVSPDGLTAMIHRDAELIELGRADTASPFVTTEQHPELQISADAASPTITDEGRAIYFHAGTDRDLYVAHRAGPGTTYSAPLPVTELNTTDRDADPFISADERYIVYACGQGICEVERL